jgi:hypothetical protein
MSKAKRVMVDGRLYLIGQTVYRASSGWSYRVSGEEGENCMTVPAYPPGTVVRHGKHQLIFDN